eukprot:PhM_4_TR2676/c0_g1_i1/m.26965
MINNNINGRCTHISVVVVVIFVVVWISTLKNDTPKQIPGRQHCNDTSVLIIIQTVKLAIGNVVFSSGVYDIVRIEERNVDVFLQANPSRTRYSVFVALAKATTCHPL